MTQVIATAACSLVPITAAGRQRETGKRYHSLPFI